MGLPPYLVARGNLTARHRGVLHAPASGCADH